MGALFPNFDADEDDPANKEPYVAIVTALGAKGDGLTRDELIAASGLADGWRFGRYLEELEECGFVRICEMKDTREPYALTEGEWNRIAIRRKALRDSSSTRKAIHVVIVTDLPMTRNAWSKEVSGFVSSDDLFAAEGLPL